MKELEGRVKHLEDSTSTGQSTNRPLENNTFSINTSQALHARTNKIEWIVDSGCTHGMAKDASMFYSLSGASEEKIYVADDYALIVSRNGDFKCQHDRISEIYDVPSMCANLLSVAQLMKTK